MAARFNKAARAAFTIAIERWRVNEEPMFLDNNVSLDFRILLFITFWITFTLECLGTDHYKSDGGGGGEFSACTIFFFAQCTNFFFRWIPLHEFFFQTNIAFFLAVKSWFIIYLFVHYTLFYTHNRSKDTAHFNVKSFRKCTHSERGGSHLERTASLCIFSVPALWNSSPTAHHNDAILHSPKQQEISVDRPNTTHKLVIMWNVTLRVCLNSGSLSFFLSREVY